MNKVFSIFFILILKLYRRVSRSFPHICRYRPSCSEYCLTSFTRFGTLVAFFLCFRRLIWCHRWGGFGYDPVPDRFFLTKKRSIKKIGTFTYSNYLNFSTYFRFTKYHSVY